MYKLLIALSLLAPALAFADAPQCETVHRNQMAIINHQRALGAESGVVDREAIWWAGMTIAMCESRYWPPIKADKCSRFWRSQLRGHLYIADITGMEDAAAINQAQQGIDGCKKP